MDEYFADKLTEIQDTEDTAYLLENNEIFYDVGYKVMQNQENANLLRCHRIKYNGKIKLIYFTREYTSLEDYIASSDMDTILNAIHSLLEALIQIENLGFLNMACIDNRLSHIYVESGTNNVKILAGTYDAVIGGTYSGVCENQGDYYLYYVTLPEAGKLTIAMTAQMEKCEVSVYSTDEEELYSHTEDCNENTKRVVASYEVYLTAGTYYIKVMEATAVLNL